MMRALFLLWSLAAVTPAQGLRCSGTATSGGSITVEVATNDSSIDVIDGGSGATTTHPVGPGKVTVVPIPVVPAGTILIISVGRGLNAKLVLVEVVG
jgi:hypothetical protein